MSTDSPLMLDAYRHNGGLAGLTGIENPHKPPDRCEAVLDACRTPPEQCVERLLVVLAQRELLPAVGRRLALDA